MTRYALETLLFTVNAAARPSRPLHGPCSMGRATAWAQRESVTRGEEMEIRESQSGAIFQIYDASGALAWRDDR